MHTLLLAFANSETDPLSSLREEDDKVHIALSERVARNDFRLVREQYATRDKLVTLLQQYQQDLCLFWYSGHAGRDRLETEDGAARSDGLAALLASCPNLKLVGLNGCSTADQVETLLNRGIPIVIATSAPVGDQVAMQFSAAFFNELSKNHRPVREAFDKALDAARVYGCIEVVSRGLDIDDSLDSNTPIWALRYSEKNADLVDNWRLPENVPSIPVNEYLNNVLSLLYEEQLKDTGQEGAPTDIMLKRLPFTISEPIRKLLAPRDNSGQLFYDQPSPDRFRMLLYAYQCLVNLLVFTLMSQLWREKVMGRQLEDIRSFTDDFRGWLFADLREESRRSLWLLLKKLAAIFEAEQIPPFFQALPQALARMEDPDNKISLDFLENQLAIGNTVPPPRATALCDETEQHLAVLLYNFGFLANYSLMSVKDISVLNYMHTPAPDYEHKIVKLQQQMTSLEERPEYADSPLKTAAVLLRCYNNTDDKLYLSPFFIDENAYTRTPKANLRYIAAFDKTNRYFHFRQVSKPEDLLRIEKKQINPLAKIRGETGGENDYYPLIYGQFSAYCEQVFGKKLDEL